MCKNRHVPDYIADTTTTFIRGNSLELLKPQSGTAKLYITSPRGDTTKLINSDGTYTQYEYSAFGTEVTGNSIADNPFEYCGEYYDDESGLIYLRNRYYDPEIGRFIAEDTHWNVDNMIYGDNQKAVKYAIIDDRKIYFDQCGKVIKTEEDKQHILSSSNILRNIYRQEDSQFYNIQRTPDLNAILQSSNLYAYAINNPIKYNDPSGESITLTIGGVSIVATAIVKGIVYVAGAAAGIIMAADLGKKVGDVLKTRKGSIQNAPKPPGTPGWDAIRDLTMAEILRRAQKGETGFKTIWKLLNDGRFKK